MALIGHVDTISRSQIEGWVIDADHPNETVSVSIIVNGSHRGMCLTTHARDDLALPNGEPVNGKCAFHFAFDPPLSPFIEQRVEVVETWTREVLNHGARVIPRPMSNRGDGGGLVPILLTSTGRTGTTLLMSEFSRHPDIVVGDHFPYEIKQIAYHAAAFRTLAADADWERSTTPETMLAPDMHHIIGSNPYNKSGLFELGGPADALREFYQSTVPSGYATLFRTAILEFYRTLANAQGKRTAAFFCEKGDVDDAAVQGARLFFDSVKDIVIVRDPRDLLCSSIAFWKLRPETAMAMLSTTIPQLARIARHAGPDTIVVRYEDLVREPVASRRMLSEFLDLDLLDHSLGEVAPIPDSHRTSRDPASSIGRWRNDLTADQIEACEAAFGAYMRHFGYESSTPAGAAARSRQTGEDPIVAAEGAFAVAAFVEQYQSENEAGVPWRQVLEISFGRQGVGDAFTLEGWSLPERGFVWSSATRSRVRLPAIRRSGQYVLHITATPFTHRTELPAQRVIVLLNGHQVGAARVRDVCVLSIEVPPRVTASEETITLTLRFPDAARPSRILGGDDDRMLGCSLHRIALFRIENDRRAAAPGPRLVDEASGFMARGAVHGRLAARLTTVLREAFRQPGLGYFGRTRLRDVPGFEVAVFIRMILALEAEFGVELREHEVDAIVTMGDIMTLLRARLPDDAEAAGIAVAMDRVGIDQQTG